MQKFKCIMTSLLICFCSAIMSTIAVFADQKLTATIPVECTTDAIVEIKSLDGAPEASEKRLELTANKQKEFHIDLYDPGSYHYQVTQIKGSNSKITYDESVYDVILFVTSNEQGVMKSEVYAKVTNTTKKSGYVKFQNSVKSDPTPVPTSKPTNQPWQPGGTSSNTADTNNIVVDAGIAAGALGFVMLALFAARILRRES